MKIITKADQGRLSESSHGQIEFKYALIDYDKGETLTPWFKCRDYVNDIFWAYYNNKPILMYGFSCDGTSYREALDKSTFSFALKLVDRLKVEDRRPIEDHQIAGISLLLHKFDQALGFEPSKVEVCDENCHIIVSVDKAWSVVPYIQSTLMLILRLGWTYDPNKDFIEQYTQNAQGSKFISPHDMAWMPRIKGTLTNILAGKVDRTQKYKITDREDIVHNYYGVVTYAQHHEEQEPVKF